MNATAISIFLILSSAAAVPETCAYKIPATPDFCQSDQEGKFHDNGANFCGPTAVSNSFIWLANHGFPRLAEETTEAKQQQIEIIKTLAADECMDTVSHEGTGPSGLMKGIKKFAEAKGYGVDRLECQSWRPLSKPFQSQRATISREWLKEAVADPRGSAWINIGWYLHDRKTNTFERKGGHWITLVGYGVKEDGTKDPSAFVAYDPARRSGNGKVAHYFHVEEIQQGKLTGNEKGLPRDASGLYKIVDGIVPKKGMEVTIIDAAVILTLKAPLDSVKP